MCIPIFRHNAPSSCLSVPFSLLLDYPSSSNRSLNLAGPMPRDPNVAHANYTFFIKLIIWLLCFLHTVQSKLLHCEICTLSLGQHLFTKSSAFVTKWSAFPYCAFVGCVSILWSPSVRLPCIRHSFTSAFSIHCALALNWNGKGAFSWLLL